MQDAFSFNGRWTSKFDIDISQAIFDKTEKIECRVKNIHYS